MHIRTKCQRIKMTSGKWILTNVFVYLRERVREREKERERERESTKDKCEGIPCLDVTVAWILGSIQIHATEHLHEHDGVNNSYIITYIAFGLRSETHGPQHKP